VAAEFEAVHNVERARQVGSVHAIIPAAELRPRVVAAVERGMARMSDARAAEPVGRSGSTSSAGRTSANTSR